jgi:hypothetical protein
MASLTIEKLRHQIVAAPIKLSPFAQAHKWKMDVFMLAYNPSPAAFHYIRKYHSNILDLLTGSMASNPSSIAYFEEHPDEMEYVIPNIISNPMLSAKVLEMLLPNNTMPYFYQRLSANPSNAAVDHLLANPERIMWVEFCTNSNSRAVAFLRKNPSKINYSYLSTNTNSSAIRMLAADPAQIDFDQLSINSNPNAFKLLMEYPEQINYNNLAFNTNPAALAYLFENAILEYPYPFGLNWRILSGNPAAISYLEANPEKVVFPKFWENPAIFEMDYQSIFDERLPELLDQLMMVSLHPDRIDRLVKMGFTSKEIAANL